MGGDGATHWELGDNRRLHVPAACATPELGGALKVMCSWSETESTRLQTSTFGSDRLRVRGGALGALGTLGVGCFKLGRYN